MLVISTSTVLPESIMPGQPDSPFVIYDENEENQPPPLERERPGVLQPLESSYPEGMSETEPHANVSQPTAQTPESRPNYARETGEYEFLTVKLREALAGRSNMFTEVELDEACGYMCSTTRDNLDVLAIEVDAQTEPLFEEYIQALYILHAGAVGARNAIGSMRRPGSPVQAAPVINVLLFTKILLPKIRDLIGLFYSIYSS